MLLPAPADQGQIIAYWTTETGWKSELQLRNNQIGTELTVTPVLRTAYGTETSLSAVTIKPEEVKSIDLDAAIGTTAPQLVGTYGSLVLRYRSPSSRSLYASLMVRNIGHPFAFHIDATGESQDLPAGSREGIWWLPKDTTTDYLILTNHGNTTLSLDLSLYDSNGRESKQQVLLGPHETRRSSVRKIILAAGLSGSYGGIKIFAAAYAGSFDSLHVLFDEKAGFSALMKMFDHDPIFAAAHAGSFDSLHVLFDEKAGFSALLKMFDHDPIFELDERDFARTAVWTLRAPMLALSNPDPALAFPPGTTLRPQFFIRNTTGKPVDTALRFNWRAESASGRAAGPALRLNPYETRRIDVAGLQDGATLPKGANWTSVTLTTKGLPDEVVAIAASYDDTLRYGAQTPFSDQLSFRWEGGMWEYDPNHNSIVTAGNGGTKPTQAAFTIFYNQGAEKYELEQALQPDEQMWIDVGKLIREHVPDKNGKTLPADLNSGSYEFRDLTDIGVGSLFEGKLIYDKTYGHVTYGCSLCCGYQSAHLTYDPLSIPFGGTSQNGVGAYDACTGGNSDVSSNFMNNWSVANTEIATVNASGKHNGVSVGSTTSNTRGLLATGQPRNCPASRFNAGSADIVTPGVPSSGGSNAFSLNLTGNLTVAGNATVAGNLASGALTVAKINNIRMADQFAAGSQTGGIQEAINSCLGSCAVTIPPGFTATLATTVNVNQLGVTIRGYGFASHIAINFAGDAFNVTQQQFKLEDVQIDQSYTATARTTAAIINGAAQTGRVRGVRVTGNGAINNGIFFKSTGFGAGAGNWVFTNIDFIGGTKWSNFALISNSSLSTTSASFFFKDIIGAHLVFTDAAYTVDGTIDTFRCENCGLDAVRGTGPIFWIRNTVGGVSPGYPRWVHIDDSYPEAAGSTILQIDAGRDIQVNGGYFATATTGAAIGAAAIGTKIDGAVFANIGQSAITIAHGAVGTRIINNHFDDTGNSSNNTFDTVSVAANTTDFDISHNYWRNLSTNKPRHGVNIAAGTSTNFRIIGNDFAGGTFGTANHLNGATGANQVIWGNNPPLPNLFTSLGNQTNGTVLFCSDCTIANPCAGSGNGAFAKRLNGVWVCN